MARQTPEARKAVEYLLPDDVAREAARSVQALSAQFASLPLDIQDQLRAVMGLQAPRMPVEAPKISHEGVDTSDFHDGLKNDPEGPGLKTWTCGRCGQDVELRKKGVHIARLRRLGKCS
jgi:hypothetical protein